MKTKKFNEFNDNLITEYLDPHAQPSYMPKSSDDLCQIIVAYMKSNYSEQQAIAKRISDLIKNAL